MLLKKPAKTSDIDKIPSKSERALEIKLDEKLSKNLRILSP